MLLSKAHKQLLSILRMYGALRKDQAAKLLRMQADYPVRIETFSKQLAGMGCIIREGEILKIDDRPVSQELLFAVDVMLRLAPCKIEMQQRGTPPFLLTFFRTKMGKLMRYDICPVEPGREPILNAMPEGIHQKYRMLVFLLEDLKQQEEIQVFCDHCFVIQIDGEIRFYIGKPQEKEESNGF